MPYDQGMPPGGPQRPPGPQGPQGPGTPPPRQGGQQMGGPPQQSPGGGIPDNLQFQMLQAQNSPKVRLGMMQNKIRALEQQLMKMQASGANPAQIGALQLQLQNAQQDYQQSQQESYAQEMGQMSQSTRGIGSNRPAPMGQSQIQQNPYLEMLLRSQLGMSGGGGGWG